MPFPLVFSALPDWIGPPRACSCCRLKKLLVSIWSSFFWRYICCCFPKNSVLATAQNLKKCLFWAPINSCAWALLKTDNRQRCVYGKGNMNTLLFSTSHYSKDFFFCKEVQCGKQCFMAYNKNPCKDHFDQMKLCVLFIVLVCFAPPLCIGMHIVQH